MAQDREFEVVRDVLVTFWVAAAFGPSDKILQRAVILCKADRKGHAKMVQLLPMAGYQQLQANHFRRRLSEPRYDVFTLGDWQGKNERRAFAAKWGGRIAILEEGKRGTTGKVHAVAPFGSLFFYYYPYFSY